MRRFTQISSSSQKAVAAPTTLLATLALLSARHMSHHNDYFSLFGLKRDVTVDLDALKKSYHAFQSQHHPDLHRGAASTASTTAPALSDEAHTTSTSTAGSSSSSSSSGPSSSSSSSEGHLKDATAYASSAYAVLKDPFLRSRYLRLLLEADAKAVLKGDRQLMPSGEDYYKLVVSHDASESSSSSNNDADDGENSTNSVSAAVRADDKQANPVNHDQEFLMEMMELNMRLAEALEHPAESAERKKELDALKAVVAGLEEGYAAQCAALYQRIAALQDQLLAPSSSSGSADVVASTVFAEAKNQFRDQVLKWTFASNLRRQINEGY